jgi:hypothetical protein
MIRCEYCKQSCFQIDYEFHKVVYSNHIFLVFQINMSTVLLQRNCLQNRKNNGNKQLSRTPLDLRSNQSICFSSVLFISLFFLFYVQLPDNRRVRLDTPCKYCHQWFDVSDASGHAVRRSITLFLQISFFTL